MKVEKQEAVNATMQVLNTLCHNRWLKAAWEGLPERDQRILLESAASLVFNDLNRTTPPLNALHHE